jgi:hypothetical protein
MIKNLLISIGIIAAAVLLWPYLPMASPHHAAPHGQTSSRGPFPCELNHSVECTREQYQQMAEESCARHRAEGGQCEIITNGQRPQAVHIPSDSELTEMSRRFDDAARRLCDNLASAGYGCHVSHH